MFAPYGRLVVPVCRPGWRNYLPTEKGVILKYYKVIDLSSVSGQPYSQP